MKGELTPDALPPLVEKLSLELPAGCELSECGKVANVVEDLSKCYGKDLRGWVVRGGWRGG